METTFSYYGAKTVLKYQKLDDYGKDVGAVIVVAHERESGPEVKVEYFMSSSRAWVIFCSTHKAYREAGFEVITTDISPFVEWTETTSEECA